MSVPMSDESKRLLKMLADGAWRPLDETLDKLAAGVPPGKAIRRYLIREAARQEKNGGPRKGPELPEARQIESGQRTLASSALNSLRKNYLEVDTVEGTDVRQVRLRPDVVPRLEKIIRIGRVYPSVDGPPADEPEVRPAPRRGTPSVEVDQQQDKTGFTCPTCGLWVVNYEQHEQFHNTHQRRGEADGSVMPIGFFYRHELENVIRSVVEDVVAGILDRDLDDFQHGMVRFLASRFADLEDLIRNRQPVGTGRGSGGGSGHH